MHTMNRINRHLRDTFLAGTFAAVPLVVTFVIIWWLDKHTSVLARWIPFGEQIPLLGLIIAVLGIYVTGILVRSLLGQYAISLIDSLLSRMPVIKPLYEAWKQVSLTPGGGGTFAKVVLVPLPGNELHMIGFTSAEAVPGSPDVCCVLVPNSPNPISGRLYLVPRSSLCFVEVSADEALKLIVSTGNYLPAAVGAALTRSAVC
jgi:uncharacterized membrane protein